MALNIGSRIGHYDVTALIGEGGMGQAGANPRRPRATMPQPEACIDERAFPAGRYPHTPSSV